MATLGVVTRGIMLLLRLEGMRARGELPEAAAAAEAVLDARPDSVALVGVRIEYARILAELGRVDDSELEFSKCETQIERDDLQSYRGQFHLSRGIARAISGRPDGAIPDLRHSEQAFASSEREVADRGYFRANLTLVKIERNLIQLVRPWMLFATSAAFFALMAVVVVVQSERLGGIDRLFRANYVLYGHTLPGRLGYWYLALALALLLWPFLMLIGLRVYVRLIDMFRSIWFSPVSNRLMLAQAWYDLGFIDEAESNIDRASRMLPLIGSRRLDGLARYVRAKIAIKRGDTRAAQQLAGDAVASLTPDDPEYGRAQELLALMLFDDGETERAVDALESLAAAVRDGSPDSRRYGCYAAWVQGLAEARNGRWQSAADHYRRAYALCDRANPLYLRVALNFAGAQTVIGNSEDAAELLRVLVAEVEVRHDLLLTDTAKSNFAAETSWILRLIARTQMELGEMTDAARTLVQFKARSFVDQFVRISANGFAAGRPVDGSLDQRVSAAARGSLYSMGLEPAVLRALEFESLDALHEALAQRRRALRRRMIEEAEPNPTNIECLQLDDVQRALQPNEAVLDFLWNTDWAGVAVIRRDTVQAFSDVGAELQEMLDATINEPPPARGSYVVETLLKAMGIERGEKMTIFVSPDGPLARLGATHTAFGPVFLLPGAAVLAALRRPLSAPQGEVLVVAADVNNDLPGVKFEVSAIQEVVSCQGGGARPDDDGAELLLEQRLWRAVHLVSHGWLSARGTDSALLLRRNGQPWLLSVDDIEAHVRARAQLVVLSACDVGQPASPDSQLGVLGMPSSFLARCGARAIVASVSPVHDALSALVMPEFYRRLVSGQTVIQALRGAESHVAELSTDDLLALAQSGRWRMSPDIKRACARGSRPLATFITRFPSLIFGDGLVSLYEPEERS
ncbi:MAG: CHAT domain-containing protein [Chloroflexota bacterium]|nr:CHAT domain-containing protein [Chloroflexota bacterium]